MEHITLPSKKAGLPSLQKIIRWAIVGIGYLISFILLDLISMPFQIFPGVIAWYPPDGISLAFLYAFGSGFSPFVILGSILSSILIYDFETPFLLNLGWAVLIALSYAVNAHFLRKLNPTQSKTTSLRNVVYWILSSLIVTFF